MRILLSEDSRKKLFLFLAKKNNCGSLKELSLVLKTPSRTLQNWRYCQERYIPSKIIPLEIENRLEILDKQEDNWGKVKGGKRTFQIILQKYGQEEIKKRQISGAKKTHIISLQRYSENKKISPSNNKNITKQETIIRIKSTDELKKGIELEITNPLFLEFYGVLLGDGWLSKWNYKGKIITLIGISGNAKLDREFFYYLKNNIKVLFNRNAYLKERPKYNSIELNFSHRFLLEKIHRELGFPIGQKINLKIHEKIYNQGYEKVKHVIRGIFDSDGCVYFDKTPVGKPYPCISIKMKAPILIRQLSDMFLKEGFRIRREKWKGVEQIKLKGGKQLNKWIKEISSSNPRNLNKLARVAQLG